MATTAGPKTKMATGMVHVGALVAVISAFLPWAKDPDTTITGLDGSDGWVIIVSAVVAGVLVIVGQKASKVRGLGIVVLIAALAALGTFAANFSDARDLHDLDSSIDVGIGLYLGMLGSLVMLVGSILYLVSAKKIAAAPIGWPAPDAHGAVAPGGWPQPGQFQPGQFQPGQFQPGQFQAGQVQPPPPPGPAAWPQPGQPQPSQPQPSQPQPAAWPQVGQPHPGEPQPGAWPQAGQSAAPPGAPLAPPPPSLPPLPPLPPPGAVPGPAGDDANATRALSQEEIETARRLKGDQHRQQ